MPRLRFQPRLMPTLATLCLLALLLYLGQWQNGKAERLSAARAQHAQRAQHSVTALGAALVDAQLLLDAPIRVRGHYEPQQQFMVDNRQEDGRAGVHVVMPMKIEGSETRILVNRGWIAWPDGRKTLPQVTTPGGLIEIHGIADVPTVKNFLLMPERAEAWPNLWPQLDLKRFQKQVSYPLQPLVLLQNRNDANDALLRNWQPPEDRVAKHKSYAMQWFGMALVLLVFYGLTTLRQNRAP